MGSPGFSVPVLRALAGSYPLVGVVTQPDRPAGRGRTLVAPAVKVAALELGLPVIQPEKLRLPAAMARLSEWNPDLIIVAAFGQILRPEVLDLPRFGCINVHGSLLPRWRGAAPVQAAILAGDPETGITIMKMDPGIDTGPILSQRSISIGPEETGGTLFEKLAHLGADLLLDTLTASLAGELRPQSQPTEGVTYAPMLRKEDELLDFNHTAEELERRVRALQPSPGAYFLVNGQSIKVCRASIAAGKIKPGQRLVQEGYPAVGTVDGVLILNVVQPAGKRAMSGKDFLRGAREWAG